MTLDNDPQRHRSPLIGDLRLPTDESGAVDEASADEPVDVLVELNLRYPGGLEAVRDAFTALIRRWSRRRRSRPVRVSSHIYQLTVSRRQLAELVALDRASTTAPPTIFKAWPDYPLYPLIDRSTTTVKADAARRAYQADGSGIVWAVIDSGVQADHKHFAGLQIATDGVAPVAGAPPPEGTPAPEPGAAVAPGAVGAPGGMPAPVDPAGAGGLPPRRRSPSTRGLHRDFTSFVCPSAFPVAPAPDSPLTDELGHGTHVAGIIAGGAPIDAVPVIAGSDEPTEGAGYVARTPTGRMLGMAPACELVSLKVLRRNAAGNYVTSSAAIIAALEYIRTEVNVTRSTMRIHGVNISLGCEWDPMHYAAGQSPLCQAVNELVASGVVVVISSGNGGSTVAFADAKQSIALMGSVTEPGHAESAITVGSTHRDSPLAFGVSWRSGKGPTLDGRCKPDVVAPGEWITSAAVGQIRQAAGLDATGIDPTVTYAEESGTSMAAPHVSGVIAGFLSNRTEYIGRPQEVKELVCRTATDLGRERYAQGAGLVDAMRLLADS